MNHYNKDWSIITSASNKFFPSLLNLIGSVKKYNPEHPQIYIYNLGLNWFYRKELESIPGVKIVEFPKFISFWRKCYTWKSYIFKNPFSKYTFYLDAGNQVTGSLDKIFKQIETDGYVLVEQKTHISEIIPTSFKSIFDLNDVDMKRDAIAAGIFGFDRDNIDFQNIINRLYDASIAGLCLGYSKEELWKNKGINKNYFIRDCPKFRHDTTIFSLLIYKYINNPRIDCSKRYSNILENSEEQLIWNLRMNYDSLSCIEIRYTDTKNIFYYNINRSIISIFLILKKLNKVLKSIRFN
jgi:hypothetical protein